MRRERSWLDRDGRSGDIHRLRLALRQGRQAGRGILPPKTLRLKGKSIEEEIEVTKKDMPNFFVEALTVSNGLVRAAAITRARAEASTI